MRMWRGGKRRWWDERTNLANRVDDDAEVLQPEILRVLVGPGRVMSTKEGLHLLAVELGSRSTKRDVGDGDGWVRGAVDVDLSPTISLPRCVEVNDFTDRRPGSGLEMEVACTDCGAVSLAITSIRSGALAGPSLAAEVGAVVSRRDVEVELSLTLGTEHQPSRETVGGVVST